MRSILSWLLPFLALGCAHTPDLDVERIAFDVAWLAHDDREGRGLATDGLADAARYVARGFEGAGLEPGGTDGSYLQRFDAPVVIRAEHAELGVNGVPFERGVDFETLLASSSSEVDTELVFAGYGIRDEASGWDDYAGVDVTGKLVLVLDDRPEVDGEPLGGNRGARFLRRAYKIATARHQGAAGVLLAPAEDVPGLPANAGREDANPMRQDAGILVLAVSRETAERLVTAGGGAGLAARQGALAARAAPQPERIPVPVRAGVRIRRERATIANVVGVLPGSDPDVSHEAIVIGAHFDHLGRGEYGSLAPDRRGEIHNGADDNASGTAGLIALGRALGAGPATRRRVVLVAFTAEEVGLAGSAHYVATPSVPIEDTAAMINLDMIGRLDEAPITVFGAESGAGLEALVRDAGRGLPAELSFAQGAFAPSDQTSFHAQGVPVLFLFSGTHTDYHTPDDDIDRVDVEGIATIARLAERVARRLADADQRTAVVQAEAPSREASARGYGPYLGTVPAFGGEPVRGVRLQAVRPGSPAEQAGLRANDVIVEFADAPVVNLEEFAALLFGARAGDRVAVVVEREGTRIETWAVLGQRR